MRSQPTKVGRTIVVVFEHGDDFYTALQQACRNHSIRSGYIPIFVAGFATVDLVGTCQRPTDSRAPMWSQVQLSNVEAVGGGTIAWDDATAQTAPHIHVAVGLKELAATGYASHLLGATVQFLTELIIVEIAEPLLQRVRDSTLYDVPLLRFGEEVR